MTCRRRRAFTFIELSLVLVIISLLVGGTLAGRALVRAAHTRSILNDLDRYNAAFVTFRDKYDSLPGDMYNATDFWGHAAGTSADNFTDSCLASSADTPIGSTATCNGDGDDLIGGADVDGVPCDGEQYWLQIQTCDNDTLGTWHHLANAKLIGGAYVTALGGSSSLSFRPHWVRAVGGNLPSSKFSPVDGFAVKYLCDVPDMLFSGASQCSHLFIYGRQSRAASYNYTDFPYYGALAPAEASSIDSKLDDGRPGTGTVRSYKGNGALTCNTTLNANTARYDVSKEGDLCQLVFKARFN